VAVDLRGERVPVLPLADTVVFPTVLSVISPGRLIWPPGFAARPPAERRIAVFLRGADEGRPPATSGSVGTLVQVEQVLNLPDGNIQMGVMGLDRVRLAGPSVPEETAMEMVVPLPGESASPADHPELTVLIRATIAAFGEVAAQADYLSSGLTHGLAALGGDARRTAYFIAHYLRTSAAERQALLEMESSPQRLEWLLHFMRNELGELSVDRQIHTTAQVELTRTQRHAMLRARLRAIRQELGEAESREAELLSLRQSLREACLPAEIADEVERELRRLDDLAAGSPERAVVETFVKTVAALPWKRASRQPLDLCRAESVMDARHHGLRAVKQRVLEHLAVLSLRERRGLSGGPDQPVLCLVGPPGVGKTSLGQSIAEATGRKFARTSLGGLTDATELRGHRRTYVGAMPGQLIQGLRRAGVNDPVFMLDEVDKLGSGGRGDASSVLLEVLDAEQNRAFRDSYLDLPVDLSHVLFIATANTTETIPEPLLDRMEVIRLPGYTEEEKCAILTDFLLPRQLTTHGLRPSDVCLDPGAAMALVREYTREAGVRQLTQCLSALLRSVAVTLHSDHPDATAINLAAVRRVLGPPRFPFRTVQGVPVAGVVTGLMWTVAGGEIMPVEAALAPGRGELRLTGRLGDVMKESLTTALSYVKASAADFGINPEVLATKDIHLHIPAGAQPKDGASAGLAAAVAIASAASGYPVPGSVAVAGEITLTGRVLAVGALREKLLAAHRSGISIALVPAENEIELDEISDELRDRMDLRLIRTAAEAFTMLLAGSPAGVPPANPGGHLE
jgi:ATP-dependent Lon protease